MKALNNQLQKNIAAPVEPNTEVISLVDELISCLDKDIEHLEKVLSNLDEMRTLVIKRDDSSLTRLLEDIKSQTEAYRRQENRRESVRAKLAESLNQKYENVTLSRLETVCGGETLQALTRRRNRLRILAEKVSKEYVSTSLLLAECARFNRELLQSILELGRKEPGTYSSDGSTKRGLNNAFFDFQF